MGKVYIGCDIGKQGFITAYNSITNEYESFPIPKVGDEIDSAALNTLVRSFLIPNCSYVAVCEALHAIFGASAKSTYEFGYVAGLIEMVFVANQISLIKVAPKKWQKEMWEGVPLQKKPSSTGKTAVNNTKAISEVAARRLFPTMDFKRTPKCKNNDDNKIDSILLCEYAKRHF